MPWTVDSPPPPAKNWSDDEKKKCVSAANAVLKDGGSDEEAVQACIHAAGKSKKEADVTAADTTVKPGEKGWINSLWAVDSRQVSHKAADYDPIGGLSGGKACANCNWFVPQDQGCILVQGDISPTGMSKFWTAVPEYIQEPMPVTIIKESSTGDQQVNGLLTSFGAFLEKLKGMAAPISGGVALASNSAAPHDGVHPALTFVRTKDASGNDRIRFFAKVSNPYKDKDKEFLSDASHKEYVAWVDASGVFPELWLWHTKGSKWGQVDWVDYADMILVVSGLVDEGKEPIAYQLAKAQAAGAEIGVSHGFACVQDKEVVLQYRTYEVSPLALDCAANAWSDFELVIKEGNMAFKDEKRKWLTDVAGVPANQVAAWEADTKGLSDKLNSLNLEFKETDTTTQPTAAEGAAASTPPADAAAAAAAATTTPAAQAAGGATLDQVLAEIKSVNQKVTDIEKQVQGIETRTKELEKSDDEKLSDQYRAKAAGAVTGGAGFRASEKGKEVGSAQEGSKDGDWEWFKNGVMPALGVPVNGTGVGAPTQAVVVPPQTPPAQGAQGGQAGGESSN